MLSRLDLAEQREIAEALSTFVSLKTLDVTWTDYLDNTPEIPHGHVHELRLLSDQMKQHLESASQHAQRLQVIFRERAAELTQAYEEAIAGNAFTAEQKQFLQSRVESNGGIVNYGVQGVQGVHELAPRESAELTAKMQNVEARHSGEGDLSRDFICKVAAGCVAGGIVSGQLEVSAFALGFAIGFGC